MTNNELNDVQLEELAAGWNKGGGGQPTRSGWNLAQNKRT
jgi:hypothetical protein